MLSIHGLRIVAFDRLIKHLELDLRVKTDIEEEYLVAQYGLGDLSKEEQEFVINVMRTEVVHYLRLRLEEL